MTDNVTQIAPTTEPAPLPRERCGTCRFWLEDMNDRDPGDADWGFGSCRNRPPVLVDCIVAALMPKLEYGRQTDPDMSPLALMSATRHPGTHSHDWCGAFEDARPVIGV